MKSVVIRFDDDLLRQLKELASDRKLSVSALVRQLVDEECRKDEKEKKGAIDFEVGKRVGREYAKQRHLVFSLMDEKDFNDAANFSKDFESANEICGFWEGIFRS